MLERIWSKCRASAADTHADTYVKKQSGASESMTKRIPSTAALVLPLIALVLAGCASGPRITTNSDPGADWSRYRTFGFFQPLGTDRYTVRSITSNQLYFFL